MTTLKLRRAVAVILIVIGLVSLAAGSPGIGGIITAAGAVLAYFNRRRVGLSFPPRAADLEDPIRRARVEQVWRDWFAVLEHGGPNEAWAVPASIQEIKAAIILGMKLYWREDYDLDTKMWEAMEGAYLTASRYKNVTDMMQGRIEAENVEDLLAAAAEFRLNARRVAGVTPLARRAAAE